VIEFLFPDFDSILADETLGELFQVVGRHEKFQLVVALCVNSELEVIFFVVVKILPLDF